MQVVNYSKGRANLAKLIENVVDNNETTIVTKNNKTVVIISLDEYNAWQETNFLLKSPANSKRLLDSIKEVEENKYFSKDLIQG